MNLQIDASGDTPALAQAAPDSHRAGNCLLLTSAALQMLVPRTLVAEVLAPALLEFSKNTGTSLVFFSWRGRRVPLLDLNRCQSQIDSDTDFGEESRVAIFHGLKQQQLLPYYGVLLTRSPRLLRVSDGDLEEVVGAQLHPAELMRIRVEGVDACIPKVDHFETSLVDLMKRTPAR